jgi:hypothetical protein
MKRTYTLAFLFSLLTLALFFCQCRKSKYNPYSDNGLPPATQKGANIFACKVNGVPWIRSTRLGTSYNYSNSRDSLGLGSRGKPDSLLNYMGILIKSRVQQGVTYSLKDTSIAWVRIDRWAPPCGPISSGYGRWQSAYGVDGSITITKFSGTYTVPSCCTYGAHDPDAILSGTFNFVVAIPGCDSIKVTDGRFDINYSTY